MKPVTRYGALAVLVGAGLGTTAFAGTAETKGGIKIKTEDGRFEASLGGRIHLDANLIDQDENGASAGKTGDLFFRRARLTLSGKAYGWEYKFEEDFAGGAPTERDLYIATQFGPGKLYLGQFKPFRGLEEMTSSNEIAFMERPYVQANFPGEQFSIGAGYKGSMEKFTYAAAIQNRKVEGDGNGSKNDMVGSARFTFAPLMSDGAVLHLGLSGSVDNLNGGRSDNVTVQYAGRNVGSFNLNSTPFIEGTFIGGEIAGVAGPLYVQGEYMQGALDLNNMTSQDVVAYYVQTSWHLTGEAKPYKAGVFKSAKPKNALGAVELKAKYEFAENKDVADREVSAITVGLNYYTNPNVRFMLDYMMADRKAGTGAVDEPKVLAARAQFSF